MLWILQHFNRQQLLLAAGVPAPFVVKWRKFFFTVCNFIPVISISFMKVFRSIDLFVRAALIQLTEFRCQRKLIRFKTWKWMRYLICEHHRLSKNSIYILKTGAIARRMVLIIFLHDYCKEVAWGDLLLYFFKLTIAMCRIYEGHALRTF